MEKFTDILAVGGKTNSLGRAGEIVRTVLADKSRLEELYECLFVNDAWIRMRAADCLEKVCRIQPDWLEVYVDRMLSELTTGSQPSIQWHLAQIVGQVKLSERQRQQAIIWLAGLLSGSDIDWIVSVNAMKAMMQFYERELIARHELQPLLEIQQSHTSNTVRKKAALFLQHL